MSVGRIPRRRVGPWCRDIISACTVSRQSRIQEAELYRNFYYTGTADASGATNNEVYAEIDQLSSSLFSPVDPRFLMEFDRSESADNRLMAEAAATYLSRDFQRRGVDECFAQAVEWGLVECSAFVKLLWGRDGFNPYLVRQNFFAVLQEGENDLSRQDAFVHTTFVTPATFERSIKGHPEESDILRLVRRRKTTEADEQPSGLRQLLIGGTIPVNLTPPQNNVPGGWVQWVKGPQPVLAPQTLAELIQVDELWVIDNEREDYTTFQLVGDIVIEGKLQRRNLCGVKHRHPFVQVTPNYTDGYFFGRSEVANLMLPQEAISAQVNGISRVMRMQEDPPLSFQGLSGDIGEKRSALMKPGGRLAELNPQFKIDNHAPKLDEGAMPWLAELHAFFHRASGFEAPITRGMGEQGVRSGVHGETMVRMASPRLRDRALAVERRYADLGALGFEMLCAKNADLFIAHKPKTPQSDPIEFLLNQIPDDFRITVDSHSSSPAFADDARRLAFDLARLRAINDVDLIRLTHPSGEDTLIANAEERHREQAAMLAAHPELLKKQSGRH